MIDNHRVVVLIPARGGSKGIRKKNIRLLGGLPLIAWSIESAKQSGFVDKTIVSTDNEEIARTALKYGAEVPFIRPDYLATDEAKGRDVVLHAVKWMQSEGYTEDDIIVLLQPTSPLRKAEDIDTAITMVVENSWNAVVSVCEVSHHPYLMTTLDNQTRKICFEPEKINKNRQEWETFYRINGAVYASRISYLIENNGFFGTDTHAYIMPSDRSVDIDGIHDFILAEMYITERVRNENTGSM